MKTFPSLSLLFVASLLSSCGGDPLQLDRRSHSQRESSGENLSLAQTTAPTATTSFGTLVGVREEKADALSGIPYAEPPVGSLRFAPPKPWSKQFGARPAATPANICPQAGGAFGTAKGAEDCLYLNVWRPKLDSVRLAGPLPVMFSSTAAPSTTVTACFPRRSANFTTGRSWLNGAWWS